MVVNFSDLMLFCDTLVTFTSCYYVILNVNKAVTLQGNEMHAGLCTHAVCAACETISCQCFGCKHSFSMKQCFQFFL